MDLVEIDMQASFVFCTFDIRHRFDLIPMVVLDRDQRD